MLALAVETKENNFKENTRIVFSLILKKTN